MAVDNARILPAAVVGAITAMPDYVAPGPRWVLGSLGVAGLIVVTSLDDAPEREPAVMVDQVRANIGNVGRTDGPAGDVPGGPGVVIAVAILAGAYLQHAAAKGLRALGVSRPHTLLGAISAAVFLLSDE